MAGSLIVAVRSALIGVIGDDYRFPDDEVEVSFQYKGGSSARHRVYTQRARFTHASAALKAGRNFRDETGRFELVVLIEGVGLSQEDTSTAALEYGVALEEIVADHKNNELGVDGLQTLVVDGDGDLNEMFNDAGHLAILTYPIRYTARLT